MASLKTLGKTVVAIVAAISLVAVCAMGFSRLRYEIKAMPDGQIIRLDHLTGAFDSPRAWKWKRVAQSTTDRAERFAESRRHTKAMTSSAPEPAKNLLEIARDAYGKSPEAAGQ